MSEERTIREASIETKLLTQRLEKCQIGDFLSWADLNEIVGRDLRAECYHALSTARRRVRASLDMVFGTISGKGIKRLSDAEIVDSSEDGTRRIRKIARKTATELTCVQDFENLSPERKTRHNAQMSLAMMMREVTGSKRVAQLESAVAASQKRLPVTDTLQEFLK